MRVRSLLVFVVLLASTSLVAPQPAQAKLECLGKTVTQKGTNGPDLLEGRPDKKDVIHGRGGNDAIRGLGANDILCGGEGDDVLIDTEGTNKFDGGTGTDDCTIRTDNKLKKCEGTVPNAPVITGTNPSSPSSDSSPTVIGSALGEGMVEVFLSDGCSGTLVETGFGSDFGSPGFDVAVPTEATTDISATVTSPALNTSTCSNSISYTHDTTNPSAPSITSSSPSSPGQSTTPTVFGTAEAGSTVALYLEGGCTGSVVTSGSAAAFESSGFTVSVNAESTTEISAQTTDGAGNGSPCSSTFSYTHDGSAPSAPTLSSSPTSPSTDTQPELTGTAEAGSTVNIYRSADCSGGTQLSGSAEEFATPGVTFVSEEGQTSTLSADATDAAGNVSACSTPYTYEHLDAIYVSSFVGNDGNSGSKSAPKAAISSAITAAAALNLDVRVAGGQSYSSEPGPITMVDGVSLLGDYGCLELPCPWTRSNLGSPTTTIFPPNVEGIIIPSSVTSATLLEGFDIRSKPGLHADKAAITVAGSPVIQHNRITGAFNTTGSFQTYGIFQNGLGTPRILNNVITNGKATSFAFAVWITSGVDMDSNVINTDFSNIDPTCTAAGTYCGGLYLGPNTTGSVTNNVIYGVKSGPVSVGIRDSSAGVNMNVHSNLVDGGGSGGASTTGYGVAIFANSPGTTQRSAAYRNNIIRGGGNSLAYGVYEDHQSATTAHPAAFNNNDLFGGTPYHFWNGTTGTDLTLSQVNSFVGPNNINADCFVDGTFHLGASSPCINAGTGTSAPPKDFEGDARPQATLFDIGPDEAT